MNRLLFLIVIQLMNLSFIMGQKVNSKTYDIMLGTLLSHSVEEIGVEEAAKLEEAVFIDSREYKEYEVSRIEGAKWVGYEQLDLTAVEKIDKHKPLIVYCSVGYRSEKIAEQLKAKGFKDVKNLYGGIFEWVNQGKPIVDSNNRSTKKVHAYSKMWGIWLDKGEKVY